MAPTPNSYENRLLASLAAADFACLEPYLRPTRLRRQQRLEDANRPIAVVYFPLRAVISVVVTDATRRRATEAALIGREGMTGWPTVLGTGTSPSIAMVQIEGDALCIGASNLRKLIRSSASLHLSLLRYVHGLIAQLCYSVLASARGNLRQRLARWLLMAQDRMDTNELQLTHEFLALMLGVRRPGVSVALEELESQGLISKARGNIQIIDRNGLAAASDGLYGGPEREIARLLNSPGKKSCGE